MPLDNLATVVAFVLPGFIGMQLRGLLVRSRKPSDFELLATSLFLSLLSYLAVAAFINACPGLAVPQKIDLAHWWFAVLLFFVAALMGLSLAALAESRPLRKWLRKKGLDLSPYPSVWNEIWRCPTGGPWAVVHLRNGTKYYGRIHKYSNDPDQDQVELWLFPVADLSGGSQPGGEANIIEGLSIYVRGDEIAAIDAWRPGEV